MEQSFTGYFDRKYASAAFANSMNLADSLGLYPSETQTIFMTSIVEVVVEDVTVEVDVLVVTVEVDVVVVVGVTVVVVGVVVVVVPGGIQHWFTHFQSEP